MARSSWKGKFLSLSNYKLDNNGISLSVPKVSHLYTFERGGIFIKPLIGKSVSVHNGRNWFKIRVSDNLLNNKFGQYSWTKKRCVYKNKKKKKKK